MYKENHTTNHPNVHHPEHYHHTEAFRHKKRRKAILKILKNLLFVGGSLFLIMVAVIAIYVSSITIPDFSNSLTVPPPSADAFPYCIPKSFFLLPL